MYWNQFSDGVDLALQLNAQAIELTCRDIEASEILGLQLEHIFASPHLSQEPPLDMTEPVRIVTKQSIFFRAYRHPSLIRENWASWVGGHRAALGKV